MATSPPSHTRTSAVTASHPPSVHGPALSGWQFHQSHGQVTVVFYVVVTARQEELDIHIGSNYLIAGIRGFEPVLKAKTYARIDPALSSWQLERPPHLRSHSRSHSRSNSRNRLLQHTRRSSGSGHESSNNGSSSSDGIGQGTANTSVNASSNADQPRNRYYRRRPLADRSQYVTQDVSASSARSRRRPIQTQAPSSSGSDYGSTSLLLDSRPASPAPSSTGSYDLLSSSLPSLPRSDVSFQSVQDAQPTAGSAAQERGTHSQEQHRQPSQRSPSSPRSPQSQSSRTSLPSTTESEGEVPGGSYADGSYAGVSSMQSSMHFSSNTSSSHPSSGAGDDLTARLVTIHLTKIDAGMWPMLISGPVPPSFYRQQQEDVIEDEDENDDEDAEIDNPRYRRHSVNALGSSDSRMSFQSDDDSGTILANRRASISSSLTTHGVDDDDDDHRGTLNEADESKFDMDPISLVLMGFQIRSAAPLLRGRGGIDEAFEYFVRSWRKADLPVATRVLVQEYLPLTGGQEIDPTRPRMIAAIGGRTALARLYCSYARLSMSNEASQGIHHHRSYLFPSGPGHSRDPYSGILLSSAGGIEGRLFDTTSPPTTRSPSSPPTSPPQQQQRGTPGRGKMSEAEFTLHNGPLVYLEESRRLDPNIVIEAIEWEEAQTISENAQLEVDAEMTADDLVNSDYFGTSEIDEKGTASSRQSKRGKRSKKGNNKGPRRKNHSNNTAADGGLVVVLSGAALVSFAVAGSMAVLGWWKRSSAAGGSGTTGIG
ncbi:unnamed protein product [Sympodiomycopsis kandeliae]